MTICIRCQAQTNITIMSIFNTDVICHTCQLKEKAHPKYDEALEEERRAMARGNFNFPGIGLPDDL